MGVYSEEGLQKLARMVSQISKKNRRAFSRKVGVSAPTIVRLEKAFYKEPKLDTLKKVAPHIGLTFEELMAMLREETSSEFREYRSAEDLYPVVQQLPHREAAKLAKFVIDRLVENYDDILDALEEDPRED